MPNETPPLRKLRRLMSRLQGFGPETVLNVMVNTRQVLEAHRIQDSYAHLNFYCNWCVHSELSKSPICYSILADLTDILRTEPAKDPTVPWYNDAIVSLLDSRTLRIQLIQFFRLHELPTFLFDRHEHWKRFYAYLLDLVSLKPIRFPRNPRGQAALVLNHIEAIAAKTNGLAAKAFWVASTSDSVPRTYWWHIELFTPHVTACGLCTMNENCRDS